MRRQRWTVSCVQPYDGGQILTLTGIDARNAHLERRVLAPFERVEACEPSSDRRTVDTRTWRRLCRALLARETPGGGLQAAAAARVDLLPYQLEPALAVRRGGASRVLIADEVGLGKTIQAGLLLAELVAAHAVERALILTPAGLRDQWAHELAARFSLDAVVIGMHALRRRCAELPPGQNPWATLPLVIASFDYVKRPDVLPGVAGSRWDLVLVDEAHGVTEGSDRFNAARTLCRLAPYVVLLTATPHSGDPKAFATLCKLGAHDDETRRDAESPPGVAPDTMLVFRRRRGDVLPGVRRRVHRLFVNPTGLEHRLQALLDRLLRAVRRERGSLDADVRLAFAVLRKRALSSAHAVAKTIERRLAHLGPEVSFTAQLSLPLDDEGETDTSDEAPLVTTPLLDDAQKERRLLLELLETASGAADAESKISRLIRLLSRLRRAGETAIVFTEYRDTLLRIRDRLPADSVMLHGGLTSPERRAVVEAFGRGAAPLLLSTDAGGEGLNLQANCRTIVNFELPWNPNRLEQRIGRVDRIGQRRPVHVFHLVARDTAEVGILARLRARVARARADFDAADPLSSISGRLGADRYGHEDIRPEVVLTRHQDEPGATARRAAASLRAEAEAEQSRLLRVRSVRRPGDEAVSRKASGALVCLTRRRTLRQALDGQVLVLAETVCENGCGVVLASRIAAFLVALDPRASISLTSLASVSAAVRAASDDVENAASAEWWRLVREQHVSFWTTHQRRQEGIARLLEGSHMPAAQAGLFERRADRQRVNDLLDRTELIADLARRRASTRLLAAAPGIHAALTLILAGARESPAR